MTDLTTLKPQIVKVDDNTAIKYSVKQEVVDLEALKIEKAGLEEQLKTKKPTDEELIELGKGMHPYYYQDKTAIETRIKEIDVILGS